MHFIDLPELRLRVVAVIDFAFAPGFLCRLIPLTRGPGVAETRKKKRRGIEVKENRFRLGSVFSSTVYLIKVWAGDKCKSIRVRLGGYIRYPLNIVLAVSLLLYKAGSGNFAPLSFSWIGFLYLVLMGMVVFSFVEVIGRDRLRIQVRKFGLRLFPFGGTIG
ncbi:hypothetical protein KFK09_017076 [Dendrobium nobile]|uniref:Uncharacterized protein n=1 Tax=Dendrobium nobile TaxID=94219 RepID=A0A8T3B0G2_DENNO|nr:hypothetical protein KFK09_017076 [Dendrobium nobile]